jgi:N-acetylglucosamine-6-phosphate deacetylase
MTAPPQRRDDVLEVLVNGRVFTGETIVSDRAVVVEGGRIQAVVAVSEAPAGAARTNLDGGLLVPGFVDLQVNGGGGVLFNDRPEIETIRTIAAAHRRFGTTTLLPTLITADRATMQTAIAAVEEAVRAGIPGVAGIHLEGPHLNPARAGVHDPAAIRPPADGDLELLLSLDRGRTLVTVAPEMVPPEMIRSLVDGGVAVSAGHTGGTFAELTAAHGAGVSGYTHLFNAMSPLSGREPGAVGAALVDPEVAAGIIVDGHHVHPASIGVAFKAKPRGKLYLVSDAMPPVGTAMTDFELGARRIEVRDGRCTTTDGRLAGAVLDMAGAVRNCVDLVGIPLDEALRMASLYPAAFLGLHDRGRISPGQRADLVLLDDALRVRATWIAGQAQWEGWSGCFAGPSGQDLP